MAFKRGNIEKQIQHIPKNVKWCWKCVVSNQRPRIIFDKGVSQQENRPNYDRRTLSGSLQGHRAKRN